jgi:hypothetical protein
VAGSRAALPTAALDGFAALAMTAVEVCAVVCAHLPRWMALPRSP